MKPGVWLHIPSIGIGIISRYLAISSHSQRKWESNRLRKNHHCRGHKNAGEGSVSSAGHLGFDQSWPMIWRRSEETSLLTYIYHINSPFEHATLIADPKQTRGSPKQSSELTPNIFNMSIRWFGSKSSFMKSNSLYMSDMTGYEDFSLDGEEPTILWCTAPTTLSLCGLQSGLTISPTHTHAHFHRTEGGLNTRAWCSSLLSCNCQ